MKTACRYALGIFFFLTIATQSWARELNSSVIDLSFIYEDRNSICKQLKESFAKNLKAQLKVDDLLASCEHDGQYLVFQFEKKGTYLLHLQRENPKYLLRSTPIPLIKEITYLAWEQGHPVDRTAQFQAGDVTPEVRRFTFTNLADCKKTIPDMLKDLAAPVAATRFATECLDLQGTYVLVHGSLCDSIDCYAKELSSSIVAPAPAPALAPTY